MEHCLDNTEDNGTKKRRNGAVSGRKSSKGRNQTGPDTVKYEYVVNI
jgi:hypothetical protein